MLIHRIIKKEAATIFLTLYQDDGKIGELLSSKDIEKKLPSRVVDDVSCLFLRRWSQSPTRSLFAVLWYLHLARIERRGAHRIQREAPGFRCRRCCQIHRALQGESVAHSARHRPDVEEFPAASV